MSQARLVRVAWKLHQATKRCPDDMIVKATRWLEDCHCKTPDWKTAFAIATHYAMLALRQMETDRSEAATDYLALALQWNSTSGNELIDIGRAHAERPHEPIHPKRYLS